MQTFCICIEEIEYVLQIINSISFNSYELILV